MRNGRTRPSPALPVASRLVAALVLVVASPALAHARDRAVPSDLLQKAWARGSVRIVVELEGAGVVPEGRLASAAEVAAQRGRIASERVAVLHALRGLDHRVLREFRTVPYVAIEVSHGALQVLGSLRGLATRVREDVLARPALAQSGPLVAAPEAWSAGWDGSGQTIAILDTGVDKTHPFLAGKVVEEACYSAEGDCPNGGTSQLGAGAGVPCTYASACVHGTHVAGIAAGDGPGAGVAFSGIARGASLVAIQVFSQFTGPFCAGAGEDPCTLSWESDQIAGLERVYELRDTHDLAAVNLSLEGEAYPDPCDAVSPAMAAVIANLRSAGIATVVSSGNGGFLDRIAMPACISAAISVGATGDGSGGLPADVILAFSNSAYFLSLLAPGYLINSSVPGGGFLNLQGTSVAAPHVTGAWAIARQANPGAPVETVLEGLRNTGKPITDFNDVTTPRIAHTVLQFSASSYSVAESAGLATITVTRTGATFGTVTVDFATSAGSAVAAQDYTDASGTLSFAAGQTSKTFTVPIIDDTGVNGPRTVNLTLTNTGHGALLGARASAVLTIGDDDAPGAFQFSAATYSRIESGGPAIITVTRSGGRASDVTVQYATGDGTAHAGADYLAASGVLTFAAGQTSQTFPVPLLDDARVNGTRTVHLALSAPGSGATLGALPTAILSILDDEVTLQFSQANYSVSEGGGSATITVTRSGPKDLPAGVTYTVLGGSAIPGADYGSAPTGVLQFPAGQGSRTFTIRIVEDTQAEGPETVLLQLSSPTGGALLGTQSTAVLTIVDNDAVGTFRFGSGRYDTSEGSAAASVTIVRSGGVASNGHVRLRSIGGGARSGVDYVAVDQVVTFLAGQTSRTVPITLLTAGTNVVVDGPRSIQLVLQEPGPAGLASLGSPLTTMVSIRDNDVGGTIQWSPASVSVSESAPSVTLHAVRTGGAADQVAVTWTITGGTAVHGVDYAGDTTGVLSFAGGSSIPGQPLIIPLLNPPGPQGTRTIQVTLRTPTGGATLGSAKTATVTVLDDEVGLRFGAASYAASEGQASLTVALVRTGPSQAAVEVTVGTVDAPDPAAGTAVAGTDYIPMTTTVRFPPGQTAKTVTVRLRDDAALDGRRTVRLKLSNPPPGAELGVPSETALTLNDNDAAGTFRFVSGTSTAPEGTSVKITVTRTGGTGGPVEVPWRITGGTASHGTVAAPGVDVLVESGGVLTFAPGETSRTIPVTILADAEIEANETITLALGPPTPSGALGSPSTATLVVVDTDRRGTIQFAAPAVSVTEANAGVPITVTRSGSLADSVSVEWFIADGTASPAAAAGPGVDVVVPAINVIEFLPGQATKTIPLEILRDQNAEGSETLVLALQNPAAGWALGAAATTTVTLVEGTVQFASPSPTVSEGSGSATIGLTRSGLTTQAATVRYTVGPPGSATPASTANACTPGADYRPVTGTVTFGPGQSQRTFSVPLCGDGEVEGDETLTLALEVVSGPVIVKAGGDAATLTITENDLGGAVRFSSATYAAAEAQGSATLTVTRTGSGGGTSVAWSVVGGTAAPGRDYTGPTAGELYFAAGQTSRTLVLPLVNTTAADGPRTLELELGSPQPAGLATLGSPMRATLTILDGEPTLRLSSATYAVGEASAAASVTVLRGGPTAGALTVDVVPQTTSGATGGTCGVGGADFAADVIHVQILAGQTAKTVAVPLCGDPQAEGPETFTVELQNPGGATLASPRTATVTLTDNDVGGVLRWSAADASGVEGTSLVLTVTRTGGGASDVTVAVSAHDGDADTPGADAVAVVDYEALVPTTLTFGAGVVSQAVTIPLLARDGVQGPRAFRLTLSAPDGGAVLGAPSTVVVWILD